jgi:DNA-directed RNA polymerase subunit RPC12/RpoP
MLLLLAVKKPLEAALRILVITPFCIVRCGQHYITITIDGGVLCIYCSRRTQLLSRSNSDLLVGCLNIPAASRSMRRFHNFQ